MGSHYAFVDDRQIAREFATGDVVRKTGLRDLLMSPYVGRVLYSNPETGKVSVQWPWGEEQDIASELVKDISGDFVPPMGIDQSYSTWESARHTHPETEAKDDAKWRKSLASGSVQRIVQQYEHKTLPVWRAACKAIHHGLDEFEAFRHINASLGDEFGSDTVRITVSNLYGFGRRLALYWKDKNRQYKVTQRERNLGKVTCPRCKEYIKPRVYRQGQRVLQCRNCGFTIHPDDLVG